MTQPSHPKGRLSMLVTQFGVWLRGKALTEPAVEANGQPPHHSVTNGSLTAGNRTPTGMEQYQKGFTSQDRVTGSAKPVRTDSRTTVDSEEYGSASLVTRMRPPDTQKYVYPSPVSHRQLWVYPSTVEPIPVWYIVAGYEDRAQQLQQQSKAQSTKENSN